MKGGLAGVKNVEFNALYEQHAEQVYRFLLRLCADPHLAEDLMQDTFLKAMEKIETFDNRCKFTTWLCQIAKNTYYDNLKKKKRHAIISLPDNETALEEDSLEEKLIEKETVHEIRKIIHQLQEPYKEVFLLRFYAELSFKEIGQIFDKSQVWGRVTYLRAKDMVLSRLENEGKI